MLSHNPFFIRSTIPTYTLHPKNKMRISHNPFFIRSTIPTLKIARPATGSEKSQSLFHQVNDSYLNFQEEQDRKIEKGHNPFFIRSTIPTFIRVCPAGGSGKIGHNPFFIRSTIPTKQEPKNKKMQSDGSQSLFHQVNDSY